LAPAHASSQFPVLALHTLPVGQLLATQLLPVQVTHFVGRQRPSWAQVVFGVALQPEQAQLCLQMPP
jgi:hypothetical protein